MKRVTFMSNERFSFAEVNMEAKKSGGKLICILLVSGVWANDSYTPVLSTYLEIAHTIDLRNAKITE